jgi:hypothetical protein
MHGCKWLFQSFHALFRASNAPLPQFESGMARACRNRAFWDRFAGGFTGLKRLRGRGDRGEENRAPTSFACVV